MIALMIFYKLVWLLKALFFCSKVRGSPESKSLVIQGWFKA
jgi:hypothetical protein